MRQLSGTDALMLYSEAPHAQNLIAPIAIYDPSTAPGGKVSFEEILALIEARLGASASFRERLAKVPFNLDRPYWVRDENFDLEYHVRHIALPAPGNWRQFCKLIARLGAHQVDMSRPPWELYVIDGLDGIEGMPKGAFATMIKLHHAAVDGVSGNELVTALHDLEGGAPGGGLPIKKWVPEKAPGDLALLGKAYVNSLKHPFRVLRSMGPLIKGLREQSGKDDNAAPAPGVVAATRFNRRVSAHRSWGSVTFSLAELKAIRSAVPGAKVNDIALALVGGAIKHYLEAKGEAPSVPLMAVMPISVRPTETQKQAAGGAGASASAGGNSFAMTPVPLGTDIADPLERVEFIRGHTEQAKSKGAVGARVLSEISELMPGALMGSAQRALTSAANRFGRTLGVHTIVTNVPGPQVPMYFCGAKAIYMSGMAPVVDGMGLINGVGSYNGDVPVCFTADRDAMPDPEFYEECLTRSFEELKAAAASTVPATPAKPKPAREPRTAKARA